MGSWLVGVSLPKMCIIVQMSNCCQSNMGKVMVDGQDRDDRQDTLDYTYLRLEWPSIDSWQERH